MKTDYKLIALFFLVIFIISCSVAPDTKETYIKEYTHFIDEIRTGNKNYTEEDWKKKDIEFKKYSEELYSEYQSEMGLFEQGKMAKLAILYASARGSSALNNAINGGEIEKVINEFTSIWNDDLKDDFKSSFEDLKEVWDKDLKGKLEGKLDDIKIILEDKEIRKDLKTKIDEIKEILKDKDLQGKVEDIAKEMEGVLGEIEEKLKEKE